MKRLIAGLLLTAALSTPAAENVRFGRNCPVFTQPNTHSPRACLKKRGALILETDSEKNGFISVRMPDCHGYAAALCITEEELKPSSRMPASLATGRKRNVRLAFGGGLDGTLGRHPDSTDTLKGQGYSLSAKLTFLAAERWAVSLAGVYQVLGLGRVVDFSGGSINGGSLDVNQRSIYYGGSLSAAFAVQSAGLEYASLAPELWLELGLTLLTPKAGYQYDEIRGDVGFTPTEKVVLLFFGPYVDVALTRYFSFVASAQGFYNVSSQSGHSLYGGKLGVALQLSL